MKTTTLLITFVMALVSVGNAFAQEFPDYFNDSQYDIQSGDKGFMRIINQGGSLTPNPNKAIIWATKVSTSTGVQKRDLFRLTSTGVHTFNSPFPNYEIKVNFASQNRMNGGILGSSNVLRLFGVTHLSLGLQNNMSLISIGNYSTIFSNNIVYDSNSVQLMMGKISSQQYPMIGSTTGDTFMLTSSIYNNKSPNMIIDGKYPVVYVGLSPLEMESSVPTSLKSKYCLFVRKGILSEDYSIAPVNSWSDFVFNKDYVLPKLSEVEDYIQANNHLPDVPSAEDVAREGYSQHEMNKILLQKIEELSLYIISQQKEIDSLKEKLALRH